HREFSTLLLIAGIRFYPTDDTPHIRTHLYSLNPLRNGLVVSKHLLGDCFDRCTMHMFVRQFALHRCFEWIHATSTRTEGRDQDAGISKVFPGSEEFDRLDTANRLIVIVEDEFHFQTR